MKSVSKYSLIFLAALLLFPSAVKSAHLFAEHEHVVCQNYSDSHFHQESTDCELFKFQETRFSYPEIIPFIVIIPQSHNQKSNSFYWFLSDFQKLSFALRGPPVSV